MMKAILLLTIVIVFFYFNLSGKNKKQTIYKTKIDTLSIKHDSLLAKISSYKNGFLMEEKEAYLFLDSFRTVRYSFRVDGFQIPLWFSKKTMYVYDIIKHGNTTEYQLDKKRKITFYNYNKEISATYYDKPVVHLGKKVKKREEKSCS